MTTASTIHRLAGFLSIVILLIARCEAMVSTSCLTAMEEVAPCVNFLLQSSKEPSGECCSGVKKLSGHIGNQKDRTAICECLKQGLAEIGTYDPELIPQIPKACRLSLTLPPIDQKTDCSK
ncbi:hypothetical protein VNO77_18651 [Canavalia gladiata]|uniref:Bifunctional inhibitor/plant lipid transfer protein/seed storage helical domain-containing protein n=1 Tax=Canavalia gladiata TaxID=3824 RepID=A0AAN9LL77_CANGL